MPKITPLLLSLLVGCRAPADSWTPADIQHADEVNSDSGEEFGLEIALLIGEMEIIPKTSIMGSVEFISGRYNPNTDDLDTIDCAISLDLSSETWRADCEDCEEAYDFVATDYAVHVNTGSCDDFGFSEEALDEFEVALGFGSDLLWYSEYPEEWNAVAETSYSEGYTRFEWLIEFD